MSSNYHVAGRFWIIVGLLLAIMTLVSISSPSKAENLDVNLKSVLGGPNKDMTYQDNYLYLLYKHGLNIINISDPENPERMGFYNDPAFFRKLDVEGDYAYVASGNKGLIIINIANKEYPYKVGSYDTDGASYGVDIEGNYAYVADSNKGLKIIDISNKSSPFKVSSYYDRGYYEALTVKENFAYIVGSQTNFKVINISKKSSPSKVGSYDLYNMKGVLLRDNRAYLAANSGGLYILNVTNKSNPTKEGNIDTSGTTFKVDVNGNIAFLADGSSGVILVNISDPENPTKENDYDTRGAANAVNIKGIYLFVLTEQGGLFTFNVSKTDNISIVGDFHTIYIAKSVIVSEKFAYVAGSSYGVFILDTKDTRLPRVTGYLDSIGTVNDIALQNNLLYTASSYGLYVINISNKISPKEVGYLSLGSNAVGIKTNGTIAYIALSSYGVAIVNISNSSNPTLISKYDTDGTANDVAVDGDFLYVADDSAGLLILNVSDPNNVTKKGSYNTDGKAIGLKIYSKDYIFVADYQDIDIIDVSNKEQPVKMRKINTGSHPYNVDIAGHYLFVALYEKGIKVYNIQDIEFPEEEVAKSTNDLAINIFTDKKNAYIADRTGGLMIFSVYREPQIPIAFIDKVAPNPAIEGETVILQGHGEDDGTVTDYNWSSSLDGILGNQNTLILNNLSFGNHSLTFKVQDEEGNWSKPENYNLVVQARPRAWINTVWPNQTNEGARVEFNGSGFDPDGFITGYLWSSSIEGVISEQPYFNISNLQSGDHNITFRVIDNDGLISQIQWRQLHINSLPTANIVSVNPASTNEGEIIKFIGGSLDPDGSVMQFEWTSPQLGLLSNSTVFSREFPWGTYTISFRVKDNEGAWSSPKQVNISINRLPIAVIQEEIPSVIGYQQHYNLTGFGIDDGTIENYQWESDIDGFLVDSSGLDTAILSSGNHKLTFRVRDNNWVWSMWANMSLRVNEKPIATIVSKPPSIVNEGETLMIEAKGIDNDGQVKAFEWYSNIEGLVSTSNQLNVAMLAPGHHTLNFTVQDNDGFWSSEAFIQISINQAPTATIIAIEPVETYLGQSIRFEGVGLDVNGSIIENMWESDLDGTLGSDASFELTSLSVGTHNITYRVKDNDGAWSKPQYQNILIKEAKESGDDDVGGFLLDIQTLKILGGAIFIIILGSVALLVSRHRIHGPPLASTYPTSQGMANLPEPAFTTEMVTVQCPGCSNRIKIEKKGYPQHIRCEQCSLAGRTDI